MVREVIIRCATLTIRPPAPESHRLPAGPYVNARSCRDVAEAPGVEHHKLLQDEINRVHAYGKAEALMFRVTADSLREYLDFDPKRKPDLVALDTLMAKTAPALKRYFHKGTPPGEPGMRMKMIGYGKLSFPTKSGKTLEWPAIGIALQKNYISVYVSLTKAGEPLLTAYKGTLGELRMGANNFSFVKFDDLETAALSSFLVEADTIFRLDIATSPTLLGL